MKSKSRRWTITALMSGLCSRTVEMSRSVNTGGDARDAVRYCSNGSNRDGPKVGRTYRL